MPDNDKISPIIAPEFLDDTYDDALFKPAFMDQDFLLSEECRPLRFQLELLKPEVILSKAQVKATILVIGSARIPDPSKTKQQLAAAEESLRIAPDDLKAQQNLKIAKNKLIYSQYYQEAEELAFLVTQHQGKPADGDLEKLHVVTGGGPSYMEAANRGAQRAGGKSIALGVSLPHEHGPNRYVTPELTFKFHYFALRKIHFLIRAKAMAVFPGGFGTLDEFFETLTLIQTGKIPALPILLFGRSFWDKLIDFNWLVETGTIAEEDLHLFRYVETAAEAWQEIKRFYTL